jgi:hypothetical protein
MQEPMEIIRVIELLKADQDRKDRDLAEHLKQLKSRPCIQTDEEAIVEHLERNRPPDVKDWGWDDILHNVPEARRSDFKLWLKEYRSEDKNLLNEPLVSMTPEEHQQAETLLKRYFDEDRSL